MSVQGELTRAAAMLAVGTPTHEAPCLLGVWVGDSVASNDAAAGRWRAWPRGGASSRFTYILAVYKCIAHPRQPRSDRVRPRQHSCSGPDTRGRCVGCTDSCRRRGRGSDAPFPIHAGGRSGRCLPPNTEAVWWVARGIVGAHRSLSASTLRPFRPRRRRRRGGGGEGRVVALCLQLLRGKKVMPNALLEPLIHAEAKGSAR